MLWVSRVIQDSLMESANACQGEYGEEKSTVALRRMFR